MEGFWRSLFLKSEGALKSGSRRIVYTPVA